MPYLRSILILTKVIEGNVRLKRKRRRKPRKLLKSVPIRKLRKRRSRKSELRSGLRKKLRLNPNPRRIPFTKARYSAKEPLVVLNRRQNPMSTLTGARQLCPVFLRPFDPLVSPTLTVFSVSELLKKMTK